MANLVELFDNIVQMQNLNGVPLAAGKLYVYALGRTRLMDSWSDVDGESLNPNPIILDDAGQAHVYVSDDFDYTLVVCDQYNNEIFSIDKYLFSEGSHSHADVAVAPSESIAVSSYHVGECTVYVPYLTGQLGKVYEGIDPIVVNNQVDKISANHVPLGVQDPLYFVQDDEEGCIIGLSGGIVPEGTMNESAFGYQDGQITSYNGSAFSAGNSYEAGSYVDIDGNTINVTGLQPAGDYQSAGDYVSASELENLQPKGDYYSASNPSGFITGVDLTDYAKTEDLTAYQEKGNYYSASNPDGFINSDAISSMATTGFVAGVSADITAMIPTALTGDYLTKESADTLYQPIGNYQEALTFNYTNDDEISGINGSAIYGQGGVTGDFTLVEGNGIQLTDDPIAQTTTISVSGDYATNTQLQTVSGEITALIPSTAGLATEDWVTAQGYLTGVDLTPYQTTAGMTAYLTTGDSAEFMTTAERSDYIPTGVSSEFYTTANTANYISEVPDTYLQNTDLATEDGKVTAISGIPLSAGGDVPEGVMVESGLEYNAVNEISGYNGSAIAQYGAEKQFIVHDDTIVSISNSAQYAFGCNISALQRLMGIDETVLFENDSLDVNNGYKTSITLSEPYSAFKNLRFEFGDIYGNGSTYYTSNFNCDYATSGGGVNSRILLKAPFGYPPSSYLMRSTQYRFTDYNTMTAECNMNFSFRTTWTACTLSYGDGTTGQAGKGIKIYKIVGIGRRQS